LVVLFLWFGAGDVGVDDFAGAGDIEDVFVDAVFYHVALDGLLGD
jgi:hypothetical protein